MEYLTISEIQDKTGLSVSTIRRRLSQANIKGKRVTKSGGGVVMLYPQTVCAQLFGSDLVSDTVSDTVTKPDTDGALLQAKYNILLQMVVRLRQELKHAKEINGIQSQVITAATERERYLIDQAERYGRQLSTVIQQQKEIQAATPSKAAAQSGGNVVLFIVAGIVIAVAITIAIIFN